MLVAASVEVRGRARLDMRAARPEAKPGMRNWKSLTILSGPPPSGSDRDVEFSPRGFWVIKSPPLVAATGVAAVEDEAANRGRNCHLRLTISFRFASSSAFAPRRAELKLRGG